MQAEAPKHSILIVEDEAGPRDALAIILRPFFTLYTADNAHAAMRILKKERIDLVTLDLKLPDRQGMDLLQEVKLEREDVEVIIITGYGSLKSAMDGIRYGAAVYLLKPFNVAELIALIQQTLEKKDRLDHLRHFLKSPGRDGGRNQTRDRPGSSCSRTTGRWVRPNGVPTNGSPPMRTWRRSSPTSCRRRIANCSITPAESVITQTFWASA